MSVDELKAKMHEYLQSGKTGMQARAKQLKAAGQEKEAKLEMGRLAVYDIFGTMLEASALKVKMNPQYASCDKSKAFIQEYLMAFITQPAEWRLKYIQAKESGREEEIALGELRLATVQEIKEEFLRISKGEGA